MYRACTDILSSSIKPLSLYLYTLLYIIVTVFGTQYRALVAGTLSSPYNFILCRARFPEPFVQFVQISRTGDTVENLLNELL